MERGRQGGRRAGGGRVGGGERKEQRRREAERLERKREGEGRYESSIYVACCIKCASSAQVTEPTHFFKAF